VHVVSAVTEAGVEDVEAREVLGKMADLWWIWLVAGIAWVIISLVILQFDDSSIKTIGVLIGFMFILTGLQQFVFAGLSSGGLRVLWLVFGMLFVVGGFVAIFDPANAFTAVADVLGFLFLLVGVFWLIEALSTKAANPLWWLGLISGMMMVLLAYWTSAQTFTTKSYMLLVFAGIWAMLHGITDIVKAFMVRSLRNVA
jgi:uncharacterized membrane protein HdeD (DUF308 family)